MTQINDEDIVISGISGVFPESDNVIELADNLFAKRDLVTEDDRRWKKGTNLMSLKIVAYNAIINVAAIRHCISFIKLSFHSLVMAL